MQRHTSAFPFDQGDRYQDQISSGIHVWLVEYRAWGSLEGIQRIREAGQIHGALPGHGPGGGPELFDANRTQTTTTAQTGGNPAGPRPRPPLNTPRELPASPAHVPPARGPVSIPGSG